MAGDLTNRIVINSPVTVASVNGPGMTTIQGTQEPGITNGPSAGRCAWLANGATLFGLTLSGGGTRNTGDTLTLQSGGGVWCADTNQLLIRCVMSNNAAAYYGGGCYLGKLQNCTLSRNAAAQGGGGAYGSYLSGSLVCSNTAFSGGGLYGATLFNCTVVQNAAPARSGGGVAFYSSGWNSIIYANFVLNSPYFQINDWDLSSQSKLTSCWTSSSSLINPADPQLTDGVHLSATSPCRGTGNALYTSGVDIDGEAWVNPPSIGCDEFYETDFTGPLLLNGILAYNADRSTPVVQGAFAFLEEHLTGEASRVTWSYGDGTGLTNQFVLYPGHTWTNAGDYNVTFTAYNYDNPTGVSTNVILQVVAPNPPVLTGTLDGTNLTLNFSAQNGLYYVVEKATDLTPPIAWSTLTTVRSFGTAVAVKDSNATNTSAFYRVRTQ